MQLLSKHSLDIYGKCYRELRYRCSKLFGSGASDHITLDLSLLHDVRLVQTICYITMSNGKQAQIKQLSSTPLEKKIKNSIFACFSDAELWHFRLGHLSFDQLKYVDIETCINSRQHGVCQICPMAKMHRSDFPLSTSRARNCFALLHVDIWGPYP
ncbi:hypothetical protein Cgig2_015431 [Carnegiea gigantea]|uniref:GAG-pre-integrase domain-containing protein n=1 Tax=Carnegiea gigantea TaxID=171969 RepID=A0A9Q1JY97_9CARY|nr:hypothetical protein Cgig2_015431 [Carnegiea gigantea]